MHCASCLQWCFHMGALTGSKSTAVCKQLQQLVAAATAFHGSSCNSWQQQQQQHSEAASMCIACGDKGIWQSGRCQVLEVRSLALLVSLEGNLLVDLCSH